MNSIRRSRKRPRLTSVNFRVFGWVLVREAAYNILRSTALMDERELWVRGMLAKYDTAHVRAWALSVLAEYEVRRIRGQ
jgi:hypothetical protein